MKTPTHYEKTPSPLTVIDSWNLDFLEGNILKYLARWREKGGTSDLEKLVDYALMLQHREASKAERGKEISLLWDERMALWDERIAQEKEKEMASEPWLMTTEEFLSRAQRCLDDRNMFALESLVKDVCTHGFVNKNDDEAKENAHDDGYDKGFKDAVSEMQDALNRFEETNMSKVSSIVTGRNEYQAFTIDVEFVGDEPNEVLQVYTPFESDVCIIDEDDRENSIYISRVALAEICKAFITGELDAEED